MQDYEQPRWAARLHIHSKIRVTAAPQWVASEVGRKTFLTEPDTRGLRRQPEHMVR